MCVMMSYVHHRVTQGMWKHARNRISSAGTGKGRMKREKMHIGEAVEEQLKVYFFINKEILILLILNIRSRRLL